MYCMEEDRENIMTWSAEGTNLDHKVTGDSRSFQCDRRDFKVIVTVSMTGKMIKIHNKLII